LGLLFGDKFGMGLLPNSFPYPGKDLCVETI